MRLVSLTLNGRTHEVAVADDEILLATLRERLWTTSTREGCAVGACGACTVLVSGSSVSSCLARTVRYDGCSIETADGLPDDDEVIAAFVAESAMQCGYCIPGFVLMTRELLRENPDPTDAQIAEHLEGNICRCGTYVEIRAAVRRAAVALRGTEDP